MYKLEVHCMGNWCVLTTGFDKKDLHTSLVDSRKHGWLWHRIVCPDGRIINLFNEEKYERIMRL